MKDHDKTKEQLISELRELHQRIAELEAAEIERERVKEALRESEERYRNIVELAPDGILTVSLKGVATSCNSAFLGLTGFSRDEILGKHISRLPTLRIEDIPRYIRIILSAAQGKTIKPFEFIWVHKNGTTRWGEAHIGLMKEGSRTMGLQLMLRDITERKQAEEALRESEERYRGIVELAPEGVVTVNMKGVVTTCNTAFLRLTGFSKDEIVGKHFSKLPTLHPQKLAQYANMLNSAIRGKLPDPFEFKWVHKDGTTRWGEAHAGLMKTGAKMTGFQAILLDITERKQAEETLRKSEERYRLMAENVTDVIWVTDMNFRFSYVSPSVERLRGYTAEEVMAQSLADVLAPASLVHAMEILEEERENIERGTVQPKTVELEFTYKDGSTVQTESTVSVLYDENKMPVGIMGSTRDISERKRAEEEREQLLAQIRGQAQRMQQILNTVPEGVVLLGADEQIILVNPVAERELVALADAKTGDTLTHLGERPLAELLTSPPKGLWHKVTADERSFQVIARPVEDGATLTGWVLVIRDVTQQREIQQRVQQQERLAAVGQLAAGIAHDFNNILATVILYAQMTARMEGLPAAVQRRMETIDGQAKHATNLIQQILDFSRRAVLERRPLDLAPLLKEHVMLLERTLPESIEIKLDCEPGQYMVNADPTRMQQMVTNLALNAREAMPQGGKLHIGLERILTKPGESPLLPEMEAGEWITVTVSDTGTGIPPDALPHIFEPFFTTRAPLGSGLGLAQVHGIVGQHGGRIDVETQVGKGTTFTIYLPLHRSEPSPALSSTELPALPTGRGETILVVEDDAVVRRALADSLELLNYQVLEVSNGQEALETLEQHQGEIALVLSDVVMPRMSGTALLHALREMGLTVQVVMLTGHPLKREMEALRAKGMADWLPKPPELEQLAEVVAQALGTDRHLAGAPIHLVSPSTESLNESWRSQSRSRH